MMVGAIMKGFNITFYDDRRLCHMEGCTEKMIAYKWDHAVRDFMDETKRFPTLCCLPKNRSLQLPPVDECTNPQKYHEVCAPSLAFLPPCLYHVPAKRQGQAAYNRCQNLTLCWTRWIQARPSGYGAQHLYRPTPTESSVITLLHS